MSSHTGDGEARPACTAHKGDVDLGAWRSASGTPAMFDVSEPTLGELLASADPNNVTDEDSA